MSSIAGSTWPSPPARTLSRSRCRGRRVSTAGHSLITAASRHSRRTRRPLRAQGSCTQNHCESFVLVVPVVSLVKRRRRRNQRSQRDELHHPARRRPAGSVLAARRTGTMTATSEATISDPAPTPIASGSCGLIPPSAAADRRAASSAATEATDEAADHRAQTVAEEQAGDIRGRGTERHPHAHLRRPLARRRMRSRRRRRAPTRSASTATGAACDASLRLLPRYASNPSRTIETVGRFDGSARRRLSSTARAVTHGFCARTRRTGGLSSVRRIGR